MHRFVQLEFTEMNINQLIDETLELQKIGLKSSKLK
jgi:hypothetical protein